MYPFFVQSVCKDITKKMIYAKKCTKICIYRKKAVPLQAVTCATCARGREKGEKQTLNIVYRYV